MLNAVCEPEGRAAAVLIRALEPTRGPRRDARGGAAARRRASCAPVPASSPRRSASASTSTARALTGRRSSSTARADRWLRRRGRRRALGSGSRRPPSCRGASAPRAARSSRGRCRGQRPPRASRARRRRRFRPRRRRWSRRRRSVPAAGAAGRRRCPVGAGAAASRGPSGAGGRGRLVGGVGRELGADSPSSSVSVGASVTAESTASALGLDVVAGVARGHDRVVGADDAGEDQGGEGPAVDGRAAVLGLHRGHRVREPDPDAGGDPRRGTAEPGVAVVVGGAGLAPGRVAGLRRGVRCRSRRRSRGSTWPRWRRPGSITCLAVILLTPLAPVSSGTGVALLVALVAPAVVAAVVDVDDPDRAAVVGGHRAREPLAARGERVVGVRHLERRHPDLEPAEDQRRVVGLERTVGDRVLGLGREVGVDAHLLRRRGDVLRPDLGPELGVHGVVRVGGRRR